MTASRTSIVVSGKRIVSLNFEFRSLRYASKLMLNTFVHGKKCTISCDSFRRRFSYALVYWCLLDDARSPVPAGFRDFFHWHLCPRTTVSVCAANVVVAVKDTLETGEIVVHSLLLFFVVFGAQGFRWRYSTLVLPSRLGHWRPLSAHASCIILEFREGWVSVVWEIKALGERYARLPHLTPWQQVTPTIYLPFNGSVLRTAFTSCVMASLREPPALHPELGDSVSAGVFEVSWKRETFL